MEKFKELSVDLKEHIIDLNKSGKSLGDISNQLQFWQDQLCKQLFVYVSLPTIGRKHKPLRAAERKLVQDGQESNKNTKKQVCNE